MYWQTLWLKLADEYWRNGEMMSYFLMSMYARYPSAGLADWPILSNFLTYGTLAIEFLVPLMLWSRRWRWWGVFLGFGMHITIAFLSPLTLFSLSAMILYFAFWDPSDVARLKAVVDSLKRRMSNVQAS